MNMKHLVCFIAANKPMQPVTIVIMPRTIERAPVILELLLSSSSDSLPESAMTVFLIIKMPPMHAPKPAN
jgi:hypothetical protein